jgi:phage host-nuclease inhibitor protein Gam
MQMQDQINAAKQAITDAQTQLDQANATLASDQAAGPQEGETPDQFAARIAADQAAVVAAQKQLGDAKRAQVELNLQLEAAQQQAAHDKRVAAQREHMAAQLAALERDLAKHPKAWDTAGKRIEAILKTHKVPMFTLGQQIASSFGDGLKKGIAAVVKALQELSDHLPHSPAKKGPLSADLAAGGRNYAQMLVDGFTSVDMTPVFGMGFGSGGGPGVRAAPSGGGTVINVHVHGALMGSSVSEVTNTIRRELIRTSRNNVNLGF